MSSLNDVEKRYLEKLLGMQSGYVLDYSDATFGEFFNRHEINIHGPEYQTYGTSKAKKIRAFWEHESDALVSRVLSEMLDAYEADYDLNNRDMDAPILKKAREIIARLSGMPTSSVLPKTIDDFLHNEFTIPNIRKLPIEAMAVSIIEGRLSEARKTMEAGAYLSTIFLCGSVLEAVLLGAAQKFPARFNQALACPKTVGGNAKRFHDWSLAQFIDVACEVGLLKPDVKKFSHGLRDFRNYIHPYEQMSSGFSPDEHTAKVCFQVLKAALASVAGERS
ncbi:hypothetical protein [Marinospirillum alkaliphilum]|uniref:Uncharacterized protein n=1 Tax=Marinospirillum alkaliphilum DSM 21637 TaxID=1122209 RepID=A0A1K1YHH9_9GAMM|nr:hypothetical protein [Marinospirillum alkaliphilum]SFX60867.1 hypothetical protein SAMN02745752_02226 [Marinospirillum alkaliphilum DSM 21637]